MPKLFFLVTEDWYFCSHRLALGQAAVDAGYEVVLLTRTDTHRELIERAGIRVESLPWRRGSFGVWRELWTWCSIFCLYLREKPDIVHHVAMKPMIYGSSAARLAGVPRIINGVAGLGFVFVSERPLVKRLRPVFRWLLGLALINARTFVLVQNPDDEALVRKLGVAPSRVVVIAGSGIDEHKFSPHPSRCALQKRCPVVTMVSRMLWDKGVGELITAARLLRARNVLVTIRLVGPAGDANPASISEATLRGWEREGLIQWEGYRSDISSVWRASDVAVLPSYREGLPRALLEAAATGLPMVATDVPGCREIVQHEQTGLLVPRRDGAALANAIERLLLDAGLRRRLGLKARASIEARFSENVILAEHLALYARLRGHFAD